MNKKLMKYALTQLSSFIKKKNSATPLIKRKPEKFEIKFVLNLIWLYNKEWFSTYKLEFTILKEVIVKGKTNITLEVSIFILNYYAINCKKPVAHSEDL